MARSRLGTTSVAVALSLGHATMFGLQSTYFPELFRPASALHRYFLRLPGRCSTWRRIIANCRDALAVYTGSTAGVSVMLILLAAITFTATLAARETKDDECLQETIRLLRHARALNGFA